jgi:thiamine-monophosphate kinase
VERYRRPSPRLALGQRLVGVASAAADVSDGLIADLGHICEASGVVGELVLDRLPLSEAARAVVAPARSRLVDLAAGGDDYELVFTAPASAAEAITSAAAAASVAVTEVGRINTPDETSAAPTKNAQVEVLLDGCPVQGGRAGYSHFGAVGAHSDKE